MSNFTEPLDAGMNNLTAYRLGLVGLKLMEYPREKIGDEIDRGLVLCRLLEESGFFLVCAKDAIQQKDSDFWITL